MKLSLIGVLQDFGTPYASLYRDGANNKLYISIAQDTIESGMFRALLFCVTPALLMSYFNHAIGLREMSTISDSKYVWNHKKGSTGKIESLGNNDITDNIVEDDFYDPLFCKQESAIKYRLTK